MNPGTNGFRIEDPPTPRIHSAAEGEPRTMARKLLDVNGLSEYLSMPKGTIYTYVSTGRIPKDCIRHIGRALRFDVAAVDRWVDEQQDPGGGPGMTGTETVY